MTDSRTTLSDGRTLAYAEYGVSDGAPVVFHHGTPGSRLLAILLDAAAREADVRVIAPDRPGFGLSDSDPGRTIEDWPTDVSALMDSLSIDRFGTVGFSGGGPFALACAANCSRAASIGLISALVPGADGGMLGTLARRIPVVLRAGFRISARFAQLRPGIVVQQYTSREVSSEVAEVAAQDFQEAFRRGTHATVHESRLFAESSSVPLPEIPAIIRHGAQDGNAPIAPARALADRESVNFQSLPEDHFGTFLDAHSDVLDSVASVL